MAVSLSAIRAYKGNEKLDYLAPLFPSLLMLFLYSMSSALNASDTHLTIYSDNVDNGTLIRYYYACFVGQFGLCAGCIIGKGGPSRVTTIGNRDMSDNTLHWKLFIFAPILYVSLFRVSGEATNFFAVRSYGEVALAGRLERADNLFAAPRDILLVNPPIVFLICLSVVLILRVKNLFAQIVGMGIAGSFVGTAILGGNRSVIVLMATLGLTVYHYRIKRLTLTTVIVVFVIGYLVVNLMPVLRAAVDPKEMAEIFSDTLKGDFSFLHLSQSGELLVGQNLMRLISGIHGDEVGYTYGSSIVTELLTYIPRAIYVDRPLPLSERFVSEFYVGVRESGGGYGFFYLMEGYWAFGLAGVGVFMLAYARIIQYVYNYFVTRMNTDYAALWYGYMVFILVITSVRTGLIGTIKAGLMYSIPFVMLYLAPSVGGAREMALKLPRRVEASRSEGIKP